MKLKRLPLPTPAVAGRYGLRIKTMLFLLLVLIVISSLLPPVRTYDEGRNLYLDQARSFLQGRLDIPDYYRDVATYHGRHFVPFPPFPAVLLLPFATLPDFTAPEVIVIGALLSVIGVITMRSLLDKLSQGKDLLPWAVAALFLGTGYWMCLVRSSGVWFFAHIVAVTALLLAINEALGRGRGILVGLLLGMAFLSRQMTIFSAIFLALVLWNNTHFVEPRRKALNLLGFLIAVFLCIDIYLAYNGARFSGMFDTGYSYITLHGFLKERVINYGLFHPAYVPFNFIHLFLQGFHISFSGATYLGGMDMDNFGTALPLASPFIFAAFWARWKKSLLWGAWLTIALTLVCTLFYYNNGWLQYNAQRFTLDFLPVLMVLVVLGVGRVGEGLWKAAVVYAVGLNVIALFCVPLLRLIPFFGG